MMLELKDPEAEPIKTIYAISDLERSDWFINFGIAHQNV